MGAVFIKLLNMSITAGILVLAVIVVRFIFRRKAPKALFPVLWALVAIRLVCPVTFESSFSLIPDAEPVAHVKLPGEHLPQTEKNPEQMQLVENVPEKPGDTVPEKFENLELPNNTEDAAFIEIVTPNIGDYTPDGAGNPFDGAGNSSEGGGFVPTTPNIEDKNGNETLQGEADSNKEPVKEFDPGESVTETDKTDVLITDNTANSNEINSNVKRTDFSEIAAVVWLVGIGIMLFYTAFSYIRIYRKVAESAPLTDKVRVCDGIESPFILGIIRPMIYLPSDIAQADKEYVLSHEKAHLKRFDHIWKPFGFLLLTVYWFNPLLWVAYVLLCKDIEFACDEMVINELGTEQKKPYSEALINCSISKKMISACPLAFGENGVKGRVKSVLHYKKPAFWVLVASALVCVALAVFFLTNPKEKEAEPFTKVSVYVGNSYAAYLDETGKIHVLYDMSGLSENNPVGATRGIDLTKQYKALGNDPEQLVAIDAEGKLSVSYHMTADELEDHVLKAIKEAMAAGGNYGTGGPQPDIARAFEEMSGVKQIYSIFPYSDYTALFEDGTVYHRGDCEELAGVVQITKAVNGVIAGIKADGTVVMSEIGDVLRKKKLDTWPDKLKQICAGSNFFVGLKEDGTVISEGVEQEYFINTIEKWSGIEELAAADDTVVGLKADGTVVAVCPKRSDKGQCEVDAWRDIVAVNTNGSLTIGVKKDGSIVMAGTVTYGGYDAFELMPGIAVEGYFNKHLSDTRTKEKLHIEEENGEKVLYLNNKKQFAVASENAIFVQDLVNQDYYDEILIGNCTEAGEPDNVTVYRIYEDGIKEYSGNLTLNLNAETIKAGDIVTFGTYEQDNQPANGKEAIQWIVLDVFDGKATLLSKSGLDAKPYHNTMEAVTWETCSLRSWLNTEFFEEAFNEIEKEQILITKLENQNNSRYETDGGTDTSDKVYLLSEDEVRGIFRLRTYGYSDESILHATAYATAQGVWETKNGEKINCSWLLRTPGETPDRVTRVSGFGGLDYNAEVNYSGVAIRPAIRIDLAGADYKITEPADVSTDGANMTRIARWKEVVPLSEAKAGYLVEFGSYEQDNVAGNGAEAIEWYVLDVKNGKALLLSRYILERMPYHERRENTTWEDCTLRKWLNGDFYQTAFTDEEKQRVVPTLLENVRNPWNTNAEYEYTEDNVFLPAIEDVLYGEYYSDINYPEETFYSFDGYFLTDSERMAKITAYGRNKDSADYFDWWLRGSSHLSFIPSLAPVQEECYRTSGIGSNGGFYNNGMVEENIGVRPAIWVEINDTLSGDNLVESIPNTGISSGADDTVSLAERLPERYSYEEVKSIFLEFFNHQAYLYPSEYPQEAHDCTYEVYCTTESKMKRVYLKTILNGEDAWFLCDPNVYLDEASPVTITRMSNETMRHLLADNAVRYLGRDTVQIPMVTKPSYHGESGPDRSLFERSIGMIYDSLSQNGFRQKSGYEDYLKLEVWISEFDMDKKLYPHAYVVINGSKVYETVFDEYTGLYQRFLNDNYTKMEPIEDQNGDLLSVGEVFDGRNIRALSFGDEEQLERVKSCAVLHYVYQKEFTETITIEGESVTVPEKNIAINEEFQVGIAFVPQYTFSQITHYNIYRSEDGGKSWFLMMEDYTEIAGDIASILIPTREHVVCYFALNGVTVQSHCILSEDGGATWSRPPQASKPNSFTSNPEIGSSVVFGTYEQDGDDTNGAEPLEWIVLDRVGDKALLLTKYTIENFTYFDKYSRSSEWAGSSMCRWLHEYFYVKSFSKEERDCIVKSRNENSDNPYTGIDGGEPTEDFVFLLSMDEVLFGKSSDGKPYFRDDAFRVTVPTAESMRYRVLYPIPYRSTWLEKDNGNTPEERWSGVTTEWWLRTPGETEYHVATVTKDGTISAPGEEGSLYDVVGIRPAIWVDVSKIPQ